MTSVATLSTTRPANYNGKSLNILMATDTKASKRKGQKRTTEREFIFGSMVEAAAKGTGLTARDKAKVDTCSPMAIATKGTTKITKDLVEVFSIGQTGTGSTENSKITTKMALVC